MTALRRALAVAAAGVALALASSVVRGTRLEVQDWDCPPAPESCARPVEVRGFPRAYLSDYHGISPVGRASLVGALLGEDLFRPRDFWLDAAAYAAVVGAAGALGSRARGRVPARGSADSGGRPGTPASPDESQRRAGARIERS